MATNITTPAYKEPGIRVVLIGKTGTGKSASGNTILRKNLFKSQPSMSSVTSSCEKKHGSCDGQKVAVVDTPGLFDTNQTNRETLTEIAKCISMAAPGPHVFLVVIQLSRFTKEEQAAVKMIQLCFGEEASKYTIVLFTHEEQLREMGGREAMGSLIKENEFLSDFMEHCHGRYHVFDNQDKHPRQVRELLEKINQLLTENGGSYYTNEMFKKAEKANREEMEKLLREHPGMSPEDAREKAEKDNSFIRAFVAGACGGAAFGIFGAAVGLGVGGPAGAALGAAVGATAGGAVTAASQKISCIVQ